MQEIIRSEVLLSVGIVIAVSLYFFYSKPNSANQKPLQNSTKTPMKKTIQSTRNSFSDSGPAAIIFFGSQTGTAEDIASRLANDISHLGVSCTTADFEEYDFSSLFDLHPNTIIGFVLSTYGEGEPTDNAVDFYDFIMDGRAKGDDTNASFEDEWTINKHAKNLSYFVFGLGNKTYEHFNAVARRVDARLQACGATRVALYGEEDDFLTWKPSLVTSVASFFGIEESSNNSRGKPHIPLFDIVKTDVSDSEVFKGELSASQTPRRFNETETGYVEVSTKKRIVYDAKNPYYAKVVARRELFTDSFDKYTAPSSNSLKNFSAPNFIKVEKDNTVRINRQCIHLELDTSGSNIRYETGDHVGIYASNNPNDVENLLKALKVNEPDAIIKLAPNPDNKQGAIAKKPFPFPCTIRTALTNYLSITSTVKQHHLEILAKYTSSVTEQEQLYKYIDSRSEYIKDIENGRVPLFEILYLFPNISVPVSVVLSELLPPITVRYYSISSSARVNASIISITAVTVRYCVQNQISGKVHYREGLATSFIERCQLGVRVPCFVRKSTFKLPRNNTANMIMIGPGTGVAPFRGFVQERAWATQLKAGNIFGDMFLFLGSRSEKDVLYLKEFEELKDRTKEKQKLELGVAYSRIGKKKVYVQDRILEKKREIYKVIEGRGYVYVCGDAKRMAAEVQGILVDIIRECGGMSEERAREYVKKMRSSGRYNEDVW